MNYRSGRQEVTSHAGLELIREYLKGKGFAGRLRRAVGSSFPATDFGVVPMLLTLLGLILLGGRRISYLRYEQSDPVLARFGGLAKLPEPRTVSAWMRRVSSKAVERLAKLNEELVRAALQRSGGRRFTLDVGGTVVCTGLPVKDAHWGYNPHRRKIPSHYPVIAYEAQEGQIVRLQNRPGNIHDGKAAVGFIKELIGPVRAAVGRRRTLELRMDGAFFRQDVLNVLDPAGVEYAMKVPFHPWLHLKQAARAYWIRVDDRTSYYETRLPVWGRVRRIVLYRRKVAHQTRKNFQLDLFTPEDGHYEYSAILTNRPSRPARCGTSTAATPATGRRTPNSRAASPSTACRASNSRPTPPSRCSPCSPSTSSEPSRPKLPPRQETPTANVEPQLNAEHLQSTPPFARMSAHELSHAAAAVVRAVENCGFGGIRLPREGLILLAAGTAALEPRRRAAFAE